ARNPVKAESITARSLLTEFQPSLEVCGCTLRASPQLLIRGSVLAFKGVPATSSSQLRGFLRSSRSRGPCGRYCRAVCPRPRGWGRRRGSPTHHPPLRVGSSTRSRSVRLPRCVHRRDRKSTRLNSSHVSISYAVFCLKKIK